MESHRVPLSEIGYGGRQRRHRPPVPRECKDEVFMELLALLGPDLGEEGEEILIRIARDAPSYLAPALEELFTDNALASYRRGLLAHLTQAFYLDDESDGSAFFGDHGVRGHHTRRGGLYGPLAAWHLGPFMILFLTDLRGGVRVLNLILNHAALIRTRTIARLNNITEDYRNMDVGPYKSHLAITGASQAYAGDDHVWRWYRGTGVGPYPCMSALQVLERTCDQLIRAGIPITTLVSVLLDGCENLAMVGLVVGLSVRHLEQADDLLDPYFTEPLIWRLEFRRVVDEQSMLAASSEGIEAPDRRKWSLREAAMSMVLGATDERAEDLRLLGETLIETARREIKQGQSEDGIENQANGGEDIEQLLAPVRAWASSLDRNKFQVRETADGLYIQATPPHEVVKALEHANEDLERTSEEIRLTVRYFVKRNETAAAEIQADELAADLATARMLLADPPNLGAPHPWDVPTLVAAAALEAYVLRQVDLPSDALTFAIDTVFTSLRNFGG